MKANSETTWIKAASSGLMMPKAAIPTPFLLDNNVVLDGAGSNAGASSEILVALDGVYLGAIQIADTLRPEAKATTRF